MRSATGALLAILLAMITAQGIYLFNLPYLGKYQTDGKRFDYDAADVIFREGLAPAALKGRQSVTVEVSHDF